MRRIDVAMSLTRICDVFIHRNTRFQGTFVRRLLATESTEVSKNETVDITTADEEPVYSMMDDPQVQEEIARKRNKSRLSPHDRNILMGLRPYNKSLEWFHNTVKYKRRMLGRYGLKGNDEPVGFAWPTQKEVKNAQEYETVAFPLSLQERWKKLELEKQRKAEEAKIRETEIMEKLAKMNQWTAELNAKVAKKEAALQAAKLRKERLLEEVRRHFGFRISSHDERFKEMLAQKEKEEKKKKKDAKKKARLEKFLTHELSETESQEQTTDSTKSVE
ncbi:large ribosomal subunit protein mL64 [Linepithema humile]|uniref:large ribosomal subunit protein mL64 n=1 Tax=Linepithema humile TaxID=83485 RepID=UPI000623959E|nr:PREDICTED: growth arrest and DNA damage-inducible proteins-interacting protein 1 [Linepithema humile]